MTRVYIGLAIAALLALAIAGAWFKGREYERDKIITAQLQAAVVINVRQRRDTIKEVIKYVDRIRFTERVLPVVQRDIVSRCLGVLPDGVSLRPVGRAAAVPAAGTGDPPAAAAGADAADRAWCEQLAADYAAGARNTERVRLALGWIDANGGADPD